MKLKEVTEPVEVTGQGEATREATREAMGEVGSIGGIIDVNNGMNENSGYYGDSSIFTQPNAYDPSIEEPPRKLTKPEFFAREGNRKQRDRITLSSIFIYISAVIGIFAADFLVKTIESLNEYMVALGGEPYDTSGFMTSQIIVSLIMIGLGIGIQMFKNRVCALIGLVGSAINVLATLTTYHKFGGWYLFLAFCYATGATFALNQRWNEYDRTGKCRGVV